MSFWTAFGDEMAKAAVQSLGLEKVESSAEHEAALDTNDDRGAKPKKRSLVGVMSMSTGKANGKDGGVVKTAGEDTAEEAQEGSESKDESKKEDKKDKKNGKHEDKKAKLLEAFGGKGKKKKEEKEEKEESGDKKKKLAAMFEKEGAASCPGSKIRSEGEGRGEGRGEGKGPMGVPIGKKIKAAMEKKAEDDKSGVRCGVDSNAKKGPDGPMLETNKDSAPIGYSIKQRVY